MAKNPLVQAVKPANPARLASAVGVKNRCVTGFHVLGDAIDNLATIDWTLNKIAAGVEDRTTFDLYQARLAAVQSTMVDLETAYRQIFLLDQPNRGQLNIRPSLKLLDGTGLDEDTEAARFIQRFRAAEQPAEPTLITNEVVAGFAELRNSKVDIQKPFVFKDLDRLADQLLPLRRARAWIAQQRRLLDTPGLSPIDATVQSLAMRGHRDVREIRIAGMSIDAKALNNFPDLPGRPPKDLSIKQVQLAIVNTLEVVVDLHRWRTASALNKAIGPKKDFFGYEENVFGLAITDAVTAQDKTKTGGVLDREATGMAICRLLEDKYDTAVSRRPDEWRATFLPGELLMKHAMAFPNEPGRSSTPPLQ